MKYYTAINIGPIIATLSLMRKPRHLWSASFIFSHLMTKIISEGVTQGGDLLSLRQITKGEKPGIGLFPDRAFFISEKSLCISTIIETSLKELAKDVFGCSDNDDKEIFIKAELLGDFFNIMGVQYERQVTVNESSIIVKLNKELDALELINRREDNNARTKVLDILMTGGYSKLYEQAFKSREFKIKSLREIAASELIPDDIEKNENITKQSKLLANNKNEYEKYYNDLEEATINLFKDKINKSYQNYFCIVQADGDNIGKVIGALKTNGDLMKLSSELLTFGKAASDLVSKYGGQPIYAGGDDLLFLCPVVSKSIDVEKDGKTETKSRNVFTLIDEIDKKYEAVKAKGKELNITDIETTMSYGVAISYYKYPLYEAFATARDLLFIEAKKESGGKNRIVVQLRKHSGSPLNFNLSKSKPDSEPKAPLIASFEKLITFSNDENLVSMVSHKLRANEELLKISQDDKTRLKAFFEKFIGLGEKKNAQNDYIEEVMTLYGLLDAGDRANIYSILRIAKFINGEKVK